MLPIYMDSEATFFFPPQGRGDPHKLILEYIKLISTQRE